MGAPSGTVTFLFTDIEGSTRLWEEFPDAMSDALIRHDSLLHDVIARHNGHVFKTMGDAFSAAFSTAGEAAAAAVDAQKGLGAEQWPTDCPIRVRMALHTGTPQWRDDDYFGPSLNRVARLLSTAHGGQIVLSQASASLLSAISEFALRDLGRHRLKDLPQPELVFQLVHPDLPQDFPPLKSLTLTTNNLPHQLTSFIGRDKEIEVVKSLIASSRLVTLTGGGGSGKTRLAVRVALELLDRFTDGVWLIELAALTDDSWVPQAVASALGLREEHGNSLLETLTEHLRARTMLLILDNCEHLISACADLTAALLQRVQHLRVLATSREPLGVPGETPWKVPVLSVPGSINALKSGGTPAAVSENESVRLFVDRAAALTHGFTLNESNARSIAQICRRLDGIPLAIELAAGRTRFLSIDQIEKRLDDRFRLLTGGARTAMPHHQTLRAAIDWSYDLLSDEERRVFRTVSVFVGGFTLEAAETLCSRQDVDADVLDLLWRLIDKSLVSMEEAGGNSRYRLLETVREYACEKQREAGEEAPARESHLEYFIRYAETAEPLISGPEQLIWLERLESDHDNFRAALDWCKSHPNVGELGVRLAASLSRFWQIHGDLTEGRRYLRELMASVAEPKVTHVWASAYGGVAKLAWSQTDNAAAREGYEKSLSIWRQLGERTRVASSLSSLGLVVAEQGEYDRALELLEESVAIRRELGDKGGAALAIGNLGLVSIYKGEYDRAMDLYKQCLAQFRVLGDEDRAAAALSNLGEISARLEDYDKASQYYDESLAIFRQIGDKDCTAAVLNHMGEVALHRGGLESARSLCMQSLQICRDLDAGWGLAEVPARLGDIARAEGKFEEARSFYEAGLQHAWKIGERRLGAPSLEGLASLAIRQGHAERAARLFGAAEALRESLKWPMRPPDRKEYSHSVEATGNSLGPGAFVSEWSAGREMTSDEVLQFALN